jgi:hypothetical protein
VTIARSFAVSRTEVTFAQWDACFAALRRLLEPATVGDPMRPLMWVSKSHAKLAAALRDMGHEVSASRIPKLLECLRYRRQVNRKTKACLSAPVGDSLVTLQRIRCRPWTVNPPVPEGARRWLRRLCGKAIQS